MTADVAASERHTDDALSTLVVSAEVAALAGRTVSIYGCTGLLGAAVIQVLILANLTRNLGISITGIARHPPDRALAPDSGFHFLQDSVTSPAVELEPASDYAVYIAGAASDYLARAGEVVDSQIVGLDRLLTRSAGRRVCFISSARVYGRQSTDRPMCEEDMAAVVPMHLDNIYDAAKRFGESLCLWHARFRGCAAVTVRLPNLYGPQETVRSETAFTSFIRQAYSDRTIRLSGSPDSTRNYAHVLDAVQGVLRAVVTSEPGEAYNIGSDEHLTVAEYAAMIGEACSGSVQLQEAAESPAPNHQSISIAKARATLGFQPQLRAEDGLPFAVARTAHTMGLSA